MDGPIYRFASYALDVHNFQLRRVGEQQDITLTDAEFQIVVALVKRSGRLVTYEDIGRQMWPHEVDKIGRDALVNRIHVHISHLRDKIVRKDDTTELIVSVPRRGYRLGVEVIDDADDQVGRQNSWNESSRLIFASTFVACLLLGITVFGFWYTRKQTSSIETPTVQSLIQLTTGSGLTLFPAVSPDGSHVAYCSDRDGSFEIFTKQLASDAPEIQLTADGGQNFQPAWSPDGQRIVYHSKKRGGIWDIPATSGKPRQLTNFGSRPAWSPDGTLIAFQSNPLADLSATARNALPPSTLWTVPAQGGEAKQTTRHGIPAGGHGSPSWSPDGRHIVFEADQYDGASVWSISINEGDVKKISPGRGYDPIYAPDGRSIYFVAGGLWEVLIAPESGEPMSTPISVTRTTGLRYPSISVDGKKIAFSMLSQDSNIWSLQLSSDMPENRATRLTDETGTRNGFPVFSPDGQKIAYSSARTGSGVDTWVMNADGTERLQVTMHPNPTDVDRPDVDHLPSWLPGMEEVAFLSIRSGERRIRAVSITTRQERVLLDLGPDLDYFRLSPDATKVALTRKEDSAINTWTTPLAEGDSRQLTFDKEMAGFPAWSPDGKWLAIELKRGDDTHIAVIPSSGGMITQLTSARGQSWPHSWSPDGDKILFAGFRNDYWNVWWVSRSTKEQKQLTAYRNLNTFVRYPAWSPLGKQIAYEYAETKGNIWVMQLN